MNNLVSKLRYGLLAGLAGLVMACGSGDGGDGPKPGCLKDADCKGNRICVEGTCVASDDSEQDTISEDNYQPNCKSHAEKVCSGDELLWYDSCGNPENMIDKCKYGCSNGGCDDGPVCDVQDIYHCFDPDWDGSFGWSHISEQDCDGVNKDYVYKSSFSGNCYIFAFTCDNYDPNTSIPFQGICDGEEQCDDGTDETGCGSAKNKSCLDQLDCFSSCSQLPSCYVGCYSAGTSKGNNKLMELMTCIFGDCEENLTGDCVNNSSKNNCSYALNDCMNDN